MGENEVVENHYSNWQLIKDLLGFYKKKRKSIIILTIMLAISFSLGLIPPIITAKIIDFFIKDATERTIGTFYTYIGILLGVMITATILRLISKHYMSIRTNEVQRDVRVESFQKLMEGDLVWHDKENTGNKMERIYEGVSSVGAFIDIYSNQLIEAVVSLIGIIGVFAFFSIKYALLAGLFMIVYLYVELKLNKRVAKETLKLRVEKEKSSGKAYEYSSNINTVKSLGIEKSTNREIATQEDIVLELRRGRKNLSTQKWIIIQTVATIFYVLFIYLVGKDILIGTLTAGSIVIYMAYVSKLQRLLNTLSSQSQRMIDIKYGVMRMMEIYNLVPEINEEGAKPLKKWEKIIIKNISFKYKEEGVLKKFNYTINKGEKIGIVGRSGSGKSTLFKLLLKLYLPQEGMIYYDKKPINKLLRESIVQKYSIVPQETEVFNVSLKENIEYSNPEVKNEELYKKALRVSMMEPVVEKLTEKDETLIGEKGVRLSGGERQRLGIARAIYRDSDIIILDESTSNLDYETERRIQEGINKELIGKTLIISAHRLTTLRGMDRIIVMKNGKIIEEGKYEELLKKKGEFFSLWKEQEKK